MKTFNLAQFDLAKYDAILDRGLSRGLGYRGGQVCIEAAICETLELPHGDDPGCVTASVRHFKISLNDSSMWPSPTARAQGLRDLGIAQLGSLGVVDDKEFNDKLREKVIRVLIPELFKKVFPNDQKCLDAANKCERDGTMQSAIDAAAAAYATTSTAAHAASAAASNATASAASAAAYAAAAHAASAAASAAAHAASAAAYLKLVAELAIDVLRELGSPGIALLDAHKGVM